MAQVELIMPKMGESVAEATITKWLKEIGESIEADESIVEIATDKVDSEVPSTSGGILIKKLFNEGDVVQVGQAIAIIDSEGETISAAPIKEEIALPLLEKITINESSEVSSPVVAEKIQNFSFNIIFGSKFV